jgi:hypothetical protein
MPDLGHVMFPSPSVECGTNTCHGQREKGGMAILCPYAYSDHVGSMRCGHPLLHRARLTCSSASGSYYRTDACIAEEKREKE